MSTSAELVSIHAVSPVLMSFGSFSSTGETLSARAVDGKKNGNRISAIHQSATMPRRPQDWLLISKSPSQEFRRRRQISVLWERSNHPEQAEQEAVLTRGHSRRNAPTSDE